jgi:hypothetical protein
MSSTTAATTTTRPDAIRAIRTVKLIDIPRSEYKITPKTDPDPAGFWLQKFSRDHAKYDYKTQQYRCDCCNISMVKWSTETCRPNVAYSVDPFIGAVLNAYNSHQDLLLNPDDILLMIELHLSQMIKKDPERFRTYFVNHVGKKKLQVNYPPDTTIDTINWSIFLNKICEMIGVDAKPNVASTFEPSFTTTTSVNRLLGNAILMDAMQEYYRYACCMTCCGIPNVRFHGSREDWVALVDKLAAFKALCTEKDWTDYLDNLKPVLDQFVNTYDGKPDLDWWSRIVHWKAGHGGSGSCPSVSGWILRFLGIYEEVMTIKINVPTMNVPIELLDENTDQKYESKLYGGFTGVNYTDGAFRPTTSAAIIVDTRSSVPIPKNDPADLSMDIFE